MASKANTVEAAFQEIVNETREAEEITNTISTGNPMETVAAPLDPEETNAQIVADYHALEHFSECVQTPTKYL